MRLKLRFIAGVAALWLHQSALAAEPYPNKTIRIIVPFLPGGATDVVTRVVAQKLNESWKRQIVVVDNRGGAGGVVGSESPRERQPTGTHW
jgi:tripartite-type tricarboxylate transporter receptor subunit TctC